MCGVVIFVSILILVILNISLGDKLLTTAWQLIFETIMLIAFGTSWIVKGESLFADKPDEERTNLTLTQKDDY